MLVCAVLCGENFGKCLNHYFAEPSTTNKAHILVSVQACDRHQGQHTLITKSFVCEKS